jgi:DNA repair protein RecO (recombination protein O)
MGSGISEGRETVGRIQRKAQLTVQWTDEAIVLSLRPHGENAGILELLTRKHGRHLGVAHGCFSSRNRATLQPGNRLNVIWRARVPEHLGVMTAEVASARAPLFFEERSALIALNAATAVAAAVLPEREPHEAAYEACDALLDSIADRDLVEWGPLFVFWELGLLNELGFGLDLTRCAVSGMANDLVYVSPRSGRGVSRDAGWAYRDRLLTLPLFVGRERTERASPADVSAGLRLTAHFLNRWVLEPCGRELPLARQRLADFAIRQTGTAASVSHDNG